VSWVNYALTLLVAFSIYVIVGAGLNLVAGYCGRLTLAHGALYGAGAYAYTLVSMAASTTVLPYAGFIIAAGVSALLSVFLALPERRLRGDFFIIASLALQAILFSLFQNWHTPGEPVGSWQNLTNGTAGISGVPRPLLLDTSLAMFAMFASAAAFATVLVIRTLVQSPWGRLIRATRDDRLVAEGLGKGVLRARVEAFAIAGATAGLGGALYAAYARYVSPDLGSVNMSVLFLSMVLIGGLGTIKGPVVGAATLLALEEGVRLLRVSDTIRANLPFLAESGFTDANLQLLVYGVLLVVLLRFRPQGLAGDHLAASVRSH